MFCKWCGADISNSTSKCTRCGKEIPAMSDCGGFYDLAPNAKEQIAEGIRIRPLAPEADFSYVDPVQDDPPMKNITTKGKPSKSRKGNGLQLVLVCIGFVVVISLVFSMSSKISDGFVALDQVNGRNDMILAELQQIKESIKPAEDSAPNKALLKEQDIQIGICVERTEIGSTVKTTADLGDFEDTLVDQVSFDNDTYSLSSVQIDIGEEEDCIDIAIGNTLDSLRKRKGTISVEINVEESVFAEIDGNVEYEWEYRMNGATEWESLDEDVFTMSEDGTAVTYFTGDLVELFEDSEMAEFRFTYERDNTKDGSLTIIVSGITISKQTLETRSNIYN